MRDGLRDARHIQNIVIAVAAWINADRSDTNARPIPIFLLINRLANPVKTATTATPTKK